MISNSVYGVVALVFLLLGAGVQTEPLPGIEGVVARGARVELVREGFAFTEGPVAAADGGIFFSDLLTADRTYRMDSAGAITVFREPTNGTNGLAVAANGDLYGVESTGKRVSRVGSDGRAVTLTEGTSSRPLMAPNDLFLDSKGGVYFTDPGPRPVEPGRIVYVYYLPPGAREPIMLDDKMVRPNGVILTNNGRVLLVNDTTSDTVYAFDVQGDGTVRNKRAFAKLAGIPADQDSGADGMAIDSEDRLYVATVTGLQVFDRSGTYLGTIPVPRQPSNAAFAGPGKRTLYITAREGLYRLQMIAQGPNRPGK